MDSQTLIYSGLTDIVTALAGVLVAFLVAYVKQHFSATQIRTASGIATEAVNFATQAAKKLGVTQDLAKYNSALAKAKELASKAGVNLSDSQWETLLESAYKKAKDGLQPLQNGTITPDNITDMITAEVEKIVPNVPVDTIVNLIQQELGKLSLSVNVAPVSVNKSKVEVLWNPPIEKTSASELAEQPHTVRVAAYCRVSTDLDTQLDSLEIQKRHFMSLVHNTPNWQLIGIYTDQGVTGTQRSKRIGFQRMIRHCEEGKIDKILCKSISRFSRNTADLLDVIGLLKEQNISVIFEKEGIDTLSLQSEFVLSAIAAIAQEESRSISENNMWANTNRFQQGIPVFSRILGYDIEKNAEEKIITINEEEAVIVREIYNLALNGMSYAKITRLMMEKGYKTVKGKSEWKENMVKRILSNERYTGDVLCQKSYTTDHLTHNRKRNCGERQQYLIESYHPGIISHEVFKKVQILSPSYRTVIRKKKSKYPFSGRVICGECWSNYQLRSSSQNSKWRCARSIIDEKLCSSTGIRETQLEAVMKKAFERRYDILNELNFHKIRMDIMRLHENALQEQT